MKPEVLELTPSARGAVSVVVLRGPGALERARSCAGSPLGEGFLGPRTLRSEEGETLDEGLVVVRGPEEVELHLHGAPPVVRRVLQRFAGERAARHEVSACIEARAESALAGAPTEAAARTLLDQSEGALRRALLALLPLGGEAAVSALAELEHLGRALRPLFEPPIVVLAGPTNAGKSTLFNALVGSERVLVSSSAGTTRDAVRELARVGPLAVQLVDTAGERGTEDLGERGALERAGQELGRSLRAEADLVLWLRPVLASDAEGVGSLSPEAFLGEGAPVRVLVTRADEGARDPELPMLSALRDPEGARRVVRETVLSALGLPDPVWVPGRAVPFGEPERSAVERASDLARAGEPGWRDPVRAVLLTEDR